MTDDFYNLTPIKPSDDGFYNLGATAPEQPAAAPKASNNPPPIVMPRSVFDMASPMGASRAPLDAEGNPVLQHKQLRVPGQNPKAERIAEPGTPEQRAAIQSHATDWYQKLQGKGSLGEQYGLDVARKTLPLGIADRVYQKRLSDAKLRFIRQEATSRDLEILGEDEARNRLNQEESQKTGFMATLKRAGDVATGLPLMAAEFGLAGVGGRALGATGKMGEIAGTAGVLTGSQAGTAAAFGQLDPKEVASQGIDNVLFSALGPLLPTEGKNVIVRALKGTGKGLGAVEGAAEAKFRLGLTEHGSNVPGALAGDPQAMKELAAQALGFGTFELAMNGAARLQERRAELRKRGFPDNSKTMLDELTKEAEKIRESYTETSGTELEAQGGTKLPVDLPKPPDVVSEKQGSISDRPTAEKYLHGSPMGGLKEIRPSQGIRDDYGYGIHFTTDPAKAEHYSKGRKAVSEYILGGSETEPPKGHVYDLGDLGIKNPLRIKTEKQYGDLLGEHGDTDRGIGDWARSQGYDAIINDVSKEHIAFTDKPFTVTPPTATGEQPKPADTTIPERDSASVRNKATDVYREELGMGERPPVEREAREVALERAKQSGVTAESIVADVLEKPRSLTRDEQGILGADKARLEREYRETKAEADRLRATGDTAGADLLTEAANKHLDSAKRFVEASEIGGSETARDLAFRQWFVKEDMSVGRMLFDLERAGPAKPNVKERVAQLSDELQKAHARIVELESKPAPEQPRPTRNRRATTGKELEQAWEEFRKVTTGKLFSNPLDPDMIVAGAKLVKAAVKDGVARLQDFLDGVAQKYGKPLNADQTDTLTKLWDDWSSPKNRPSIPETKRIENAIKSAEKRKAALEQKLATGDLSKTTKPPLNSPELDAVRAEVADLNAQLATARSQADIQKRIDAEDFDAKPKSPKPMSRELQDAKTNQRKLREEFERLKQQNEIKNATPIAKSLRIVREIANGIPRTMMASVDAFMGRQGLMPLMSHPIQSLKGLGEHWAAFFSEAAADRATTRLENRPNFVEGNYKRWGLDLTSQHGEEGFFSHFFDKLDNIPKVGKYIKHFNLPEMSERSFRVGSNRMRADMIDFLVGNHVARNGSISDAEGKVYANFVNNGTGRLSASTLKTSLTHMNDILFAPQFSASRIALATGRPLFWNLKEKGFGLRETGAARKVIATEYARAAASALTVIGLVKLASWALGRDDVDVGFKPDSPDFLQVKVGDTRIDMTGGLKQYWTMLARSAKWAREPSRNRSPADLIAQSARQKLAPAPSLIAELITGKDAVGNKMTPGEALANKTQPLYIKDLIDAFKAQDIPEAVAISLLGLHGFGINTYKPKPKKR